MEPKKDWRAETAEFIRGERFRREKYNPSGKGWNHDHCAACWVKFAESEGQEIRHEGYATIAESKWGADYHWVCIQCFCDLHEVMGWIEVA